MWTTMEELNADFAKAFAVAAVGVVCTSLGIAYYFHKLEEKQLYIFRVTMEDGNEHYVASRNEEDAMGVAVDCGYVPRRARRVGAADDNVMAGFL